MATSRSVFNSNLTLLRKQLADENAMKRRAAQSNLFPSIDKSELSITSHDDANNNSIFKNRIRAPIQIFQSSGSGFNPEGGPVVGKHQLPALKIPLRGMLSPNNINSNSVERITSGRESYASHHSPIKEAIYKRKGNNTTLKQRPVFGSLENHPSVTE